MFEKNGLSSETFFSKASSRFFVALSILTIVLLAQGPVFATDPLEADPNPDLTSNEPARLIVVDKLEDVDAKSLPPGHYLIVATEENRTFEIQVQ